MAYPSRQRRSLRFLSCEKLETRLCLSAVSFASHDIEAIGWESVFAGDLDGDGDMDVLSSSSTLGGKITWYEQFQRAEGDANLDIHFDQQDIVQVLQAAK